MMIAAELYEVLMMLASETGLMHGRTFWGFHGAVKVLVG